MEKHIGAFNCIGEMCTYKMYNILNRLLVLLFVSHTYIGYMRNISSFKELVDPNSLLIRH